MVGETCGDNRFEIIKIAKESLIKATNIEDSKDEMEVIDNILFRCWQMGWLDKYKDKEDKYKNAWEELKLMVNAVAFDKVRTTMRDLENKHGIEVK